MYEHSVENSYGHFAVLRVSQISKMVSRERHRMEAFVRFSLTTDGIYFATIEPDYNVIPVLVRHFKNRYADQKWIIYDTKRKYGIYYDLSTVTEIELHFSEEFREQSPLVFSESEEIYQALWRDYFKHTNIPARKNTKLHIRHVPKRYWKLLVEKH
jgi:probable DNA metabolism protein